MRFLLKLFVFIAILFIINSNFCSRNKIRKNNNVNFDKKEVIKDNKNDDYTKESIVFYAKKDCNSNERIARKGILVKRNNAKATVLILHGYGNNKFSVAPFRVFFKKYNCFTFDFRAHGEEIEDQYCTIGFDEVNDLFAAVDYIRSRPDLKDLPLLIWAPSMGASTAIEAQAIDPTLSKGLFLDSPFSSTETFIKNGISKMKLEVFGYKFDFPGSRLLERYAFNAYVQSVLKYLLKKLTHIDATKIQTFIKKPIFPGKSIEKITVPVKFSICKNDEKISEDEVRKMYDKHPGIKRLWITNGRDHCDSVFNDPERYEQMANDFFESILTGEIYNQPKEIIIIDPEE